MSSANSTASSVAGDTPPPPGSGSGNGDKDVNRAQCLINVYMVTKAGDSTLSHCIPIRDGTLSADALKTLTLKTIRQLLIKKKALTLSRYGCAFCTPAGAQIDNQAFFVDYLDLVRKELLAKKGSSAEKTDTPPKDSETDQNAVGGLDGVAEYNVYLQEKIKHIVDKEVLKLISEGNHSKPGEAPKLLEHGKIEKLARLYDASKVVATSGGELPNPAEMSEKNWHAVMRMNSLMNAHRFAFTQSGSNDKGEKKLVFRRVEKAPYSAFELVPREFGLHEVSNDVTKSDDDDDSQEEVSLRIPRFIVADDSYVNVFETQSAVQNSMAQSSFSQTEVEAGVGGGAFGFSAAISGGFSNSQTTALAEKKNEEQKTMNITYNFPRVIVHLDPKSIRLSSECERDLQAVINSQDSSMLFDFYQRYGQFFATRVELGGRLFSSENYEDLGTDEKKEAAQMMKASAKASFTSSYVQASVKASHENQSASAEEQKNNSLKGSISWQAQGGNTLLCNNPPEWVPTVAPFLNWRVIKQEDVVPLAQYIGQIPGYEHVPKAFESITEGNNKLVGINMKFKLMTEQGDSGKYLALIDDPDQKNLRAGLMNMLESANKDQKQVQLAMALSSIQCKEQQKRIKAEKYSPGSLQVRELDDAAEFQVDVKTYLDGVPRIMYNHWYRISNKKLKKYVTASRGPIPQGGFTSFGYGEKSQAIFFKFLSPQGKTEGVVQGEVGELAAISPKHQDWGTLALPKLVDAKFPTVKFDAVKSDGTPAAVPEIHKGLERCRWKFEF